MNSVYYPLPDYDSLTVKLAGSISGATVVLPSVFSVGYSYIDFWIDLNLAVGTPINLITFTYISSPTGISPIVNTPGDDTQRTDSNTVVLGAYTSSPYTGSIALVAGTRRILVTCPAAGAKTRLGITFNSADAASTLAVYANRRL